MSFNEKSDWCSFVSISLFAFFFGELAWGLLDPSRPRHNTLIFFVVVVALIIAIQVVTHVILAVRSPSEANAALDERERQIHLRATRPAYYVLLVGALLVVGTLHLSVDRWLMAHCVLLVIWLAEMTNYGTRLYFYRREA